MLINWHWTIFLTKTPFGNEIYFNWFLSGLILTINVSICAWIIAFIIGSLLGILYTLPYRCSFAISKCYVELFRNIPLIIQLFIWYLVIPELLPKNIEYWFKIELDHNTQLFLLSIICLGCFTAARICEQVRLGIQSLSIDQLNAALAIGLTMPQAYYYVILPNAYRTIIPPMTSEILNLIKNSSVTSTIGLSEMTAQINKLLNYSSYTYESFIIITLSYLLINTFIMFLMYIIEKKVFTLQKWRGK